MNQNNLTNTNPLLNVQQAAEFLGVNVGTIRRWARSKALTGLKVGIRGDWRFTKEDLLQLTISNHDNRLSRKQKAESRKQKAESRKQKAEKYSL